MSNTKKADLLFFIMVLTHLLIVFSLWVFGQNLPITINQSLILSQLLILVPAAIYLFLSKTNPLTLSRFKRIDFATVGMVVLFTFLMMPLVSFINTVSMLFTENQVAQLALDMGKNPFWVNLFLMAIVPAISEEFVFRGVLFHTYRKSSVLYGAIISGIVFGLMHMNFNQFSYAFVLGIVFALLIEATGSIYASMIAHFVINGSSVVSIKISDMYLKYMGEQGQEMMLQTDMSKEQLLLMAFALGIVAVGTTALAIGVYIWMMHHCKRVNHMKAVFWIRKGEDRFQIRKAISPWLVLSICMCIGFMIYSQMISVAQAPPTQMEQEINEPDGNTLQIGSDFLK